jgi:glycosyltransferase involved in cell wall biosynthesis
MKILLLSRYAQLGSSSRLRLYQYLPYLKDAGILVTVAPLFDDDYIKGIYSNKVSKLSVFIAYIRRLFLMLRARQFDVVWLEKEMLPWVPAWLELALFSRKVPLVVDYDDAVFHRYDMHQSSIVRRLLGQKIDKIMKRANLVVVGNEYLANRAQNSGAKRVEVLPTVVDMMRYTVHKPANNKSTVVGWIGSPSTAKFLHQIGPALKEVVASRGVQIIAIGPNTEQLKDLPIKILPWTEETEVSDICNFDIGIMPLPDAPFERGKCGYKLIQYMACNKPVVASPVGVNQRIVSHGVNGFLASTYEEWVQALLHLIDNPMLRKEMGVMGRQKVEAEYSLQIAVGRLIELLKSVV